MQRTKDGSVRGRIDYRFDAAGRVVGYAIYGQSGKLLGRMSAQKPSTSRARL
jgi:hypothetical protein